MITSGRCHGPGCTREARVEFWCEELCQENWNRQHDGPLVEGVPFAEACRNIEANLPTLAATGTNGPLRIDILGDSADRFSEPSPEFRQAIRNLGASMGAAAAIAASGVGLAVARRAEEAELAPYLEAMDEAARQVAERAGIPASLLTSRGATYPLVASKDPQVGRFRSWLDRLFERTP